MARQQTKKDEKFMRIFCLAVFCILLYMRVDSWLGFTLAEHNLLPETNIICEDITKVSVIRPGRHSGGYFHYYELTFQNGMILSIPEKAVENANMLTQPEDLIGKELTVIYYPGLIPFPVGRLVCAKLGNSFIISSEAAMDEFRLWIDLWGIYLILPGICVVFIYMDVFFKSSFWQRIHYRIKKYIRDRRKKKEMQ